MKSIIIIHLILLVVYQVSSKPSEKLVDDLEKILRSDPDEFINTTLLIKSKGYPAEEHQVFTDDGYIITMQRIPQSSPSPVVLLQHGLLDASSTWAMNFRQQSLAFILADAGYDVWLGNMRGNTYARKHVKLDPSQEQFWDFSWDEMAQHDLPSMVNYTLKITGQKNLYYIGHSQGTLIGFSGFGINPDLASKIKLFIALGPVATVNHIVSPIKILADIGAQSNQEIWYKLFGKKDFLPSNEIIELLADKACNIEPIDEAICKNILLVLCGPSKFLNVTRIPVYTTHAPAGTSTKNMAHFAQMVISGNFQMYDYGSPDANQAHYNQTVAPFYDLKKVKLPVALYWSQNDWLADTVDVQFIKENLPNIVDEANLSDWNHLDFVWATNGKSYLYDRILALMKKYNE